MTNEYRDGIFVGRVGNGSVDGCFRTCGDNN